MSTLAAGQRWISETEPELGMGILVSIDKRFLTIEFPASDCTRQYSLKAAPIRRAKFKPGDKIHTVDHQEILVESVEKKKVRKWVGFRRVISSVGYPAGSTCRRHICKYIYLANKEQPFFC